MAKQRLMKQKMPTVLHLNGQWITVRDWKDALFFLSLPVVAFLIFAIVKAYQLNKQKLKKAKEQKAKEEKEK